MSLRFLDNPARYKVPRVLYLVRWINSKNDIAKKCYLRKAAAVQYWEIRKKYMKGPCWIETFNLTLTEDDFYGAEIPRTFLEANS